MGPWEETVGGHQPITWVAPPKEDWTGKEAEAEAARARRGRAGGGQARSHMTSLASLGQVLNSQIPKMTERLGAGDTPCCAKPWRGPTALPRPDRQAARLLQEVPHGQAASSPYASDGATREAT